MNDRFGIPRAAYQLSLAIAPLAVIASAIPLLWPAVYRDAAWLVPQARGQDAVTLAVALALIPTLLGSWRGSARHTVVWLGLVGYLLYTYAGAAFAYALNELFLIYVALLSLASFTLVLTVRSLDVSALAAHADDALPRRSISIFLYALAGMLCALWLGQLAPFFMHGIVPDSVARSDGGLQFVFVLDLGFVLPLSLVGAQLLRQRRPWGLVLAALVLIKATTMGLALVSMTLFSVAAGERAEMGLSALWVALASTGLILSSWLLNAMGRSERLSYAPPPSDHRHDRFDRNPRSLARADRRRA